MPDKKAKEDTSEIPKSFEKNFEKGAVIFCANPVFRQSELMIKNGKRVGIILLKQIVKAFLTDSAAHKGEINKKIRV